jgi:hypothetical protein
MVCGSSWLSGRVGTELGLRSVRLDLYREVTQHGALWVACVKLTPWPTRAYHISLTSHGAGWAAG